MKSLRSFAVTGAALTLLALSVSGQVATAEPSSATTAAAPTPQTIRISTYNVQHALSAETAVSDIEKLAAGSDIVTLQEMGSGARRRGVRAALLDCSLCPFEGYFPTPAVPGSTPILYRWDRFRLEATGSVQVSEDTFVGAAGAGPRTLRAKYVNWVRLRERATGRSLYVLNNHAVPTVQGRDGGPNRNYPARLALYGQHMSGLTSLITKLKADGSLVFVTGDFNVNFRRDRTVQAALFPYVRLGAVGMSASFATLGEPGRGTHSDRLIDYVWYLRQDAAKPVAQRVLRGYASDHRPLVVTFALTPR
jgi:endonuclease/exonuclease/phosphatase (EEP) superfamily protein YafD